MVVREKTTQNTFVDEPTMLAIDIRDKALRELEATIKLSRGHVQKILEGTETPTKEHLEKTRKAIAAVSQLLKDVLEPNIDLWRCIQKIPTSER